MTGGFILKRTLKRLKYLLFRLIYMASHSLAFLTLKSVKPRDPSALDYIILVGVELESPYDIAKIAAFTTQLPKELRNMNIALFSKVQTWDIDAGDLCVQIYPWKFETRARLIAPWMKLLYRSVGDDARIDAIARRSVSMFDLGDYQLDATKATGWTANALSNIVFAKRYDLNYYMMPQSIGPLRFRQPFAAILHPMLKITLSYASVICARENWGLTALKQIVPSDVPVIRCPDILFYCTQKRFHYKAPGVNTLVFAHNDNTNLEGPPIADILDALGNTAAQKGFVKRVRYLKKPLTVDCSEGKSTEDWQEIVFDAAAESRLSTLCSYQWIVTDAHKTAIFLLSRGIIPIFIGCDAIAQDIYAQLGLKKFIVESGDPNIILSQIQELADGHKQYLQQLHARVRQIIDSHPLPKFC